jgi:hypothetical protein
VRGEDVMQQVGDECLEGKGVAQDGEDVEENDSLRGESAGCGSERERVSPADTPSAPSWGSRGGPRGST